MRIEFGPRLDWSGSSPDLTNIVREGEVTMAQVASRIGVSVDALIASNPKLNPNRLKPGQIIELPSPKQQAQCLEPKQAGGGSETPSPATLASKAAESQLSSLAVKSSLNRPVVGPATANGWQAAGPSTTFAASGGAQNIDGRLSAKARYDELPSDLRAKMRQKVWEALPEGQRSTLVASYQQFKRAGVWDEITEVIGQKEKREAPVRLPGGYETDVAGNSGAIQYRVRDANSFTQKMLEMNPNFGVDGGVMGAMHEGQLSMREAGPPTSLHVSVGPGNLMDAHIDRQNPVDQPKNQQTQMNVGRGAKHWQQEVLPEMIRKLVGLPGVIIDGYIKGGGRTEPGAPGPDWEPNGQRSGEGRVMVNLEFHGLRKRKLELHKEPMEGSPEVPDQVMKKVAQQLDDGSVKIRFPRPAGVEKGGEPDAKEVAATLAAKMKEAVENGDSRISIDLNIYAGLKGLQKPVIGELRRLADVVREELKASGVDVGNVTALTVTFGRKTEGETVSITHNGQ